MNQSFRKERVSVADQFLDEQARLAEGELSEAELKLQQFQKQHFAGVPLDANVSLTTLVELQSQMATARADMDASQDVRTSIDRRLQEHRRLKTVLQSPPPPRAAVAKVDPTEASLQQQLAAKRAEFDAISAKYTNAHPDVVRAAREVRDMEARLKDYRDSKIEDGTASNVPAEPAQTDPLLGKAPIADFEEGEIQLELERADRDLAKRKQTINEISRRIQLLQARLSPSPEVSQELTLLVGNQESAKQRYSYLSGRKANAELAASVDTNEKNETFKVVDEANLPVLPVRPNRPMLATLSTLGSLLLGLGIAFFREYCDPSLRSEDEAAAELKLPVLSIPEFTIDRKELRRGMAMQKKSSPPADGTFDLDRADIRVRKIIEDPVTVAGEQFRLVRAKLAAVQKERPIKTVLVTSSIPSEGKTFTACCLAGILAREPGKRVLLIDADLRTGNARRVLGVELQSPPRGLGEILRGQNDLPSLDRSIQRCAQSNFYFLPSGEVFDNPTELLSSPRLEQLLQDLAPSFDWILVDSAPLLNLADANLAAPLCDATLLVACAGKTPTKFVQTAIQKIGPQRVIGVLLNRVRRLPSSSYYSRYYKNYHRVPKRRKDVAVQA
jgi:capsular exopolysaccharide synthesis family protein